MKATKRIMMMGVITIGLIGCQSETTNPYSPEQMLNNALEETANPKAYYAEAEIITIEKEKEIESVFMKEWRSNEGKIRVETTDKDGTKIGVSVNDRNTLVTYLPKENQAFLIDDPEMLSFNQPSPKEQVNYILEMVRDTHEMMEKEGEKIAGRSTYHLLAKPAGENMLFGELELWIDKENWMVLKMILHSGDTIAETTYTNIKPGESMSEKTFTLDLPDDVDIQNMSDISQASEVTLEEATESIGPFLHFTENNGRQISTVEMIHLNGEINRKEITIDYKKDDLPLLTMSVFPSPKEIDETKLEGERSIAIRNQEGLFLEFNEFRTITWQENDMTYSILLIDPALTLEAVAVLADEMEIVE